MRKYVLIIIVAFATLLHACKKEGVKVSLGTSTEQVGNYQKAYLDNNNIICFFENDDVNINGESVLMPQNGNNGMVNVTKASTYRAIYPRSIVTSTITTSSSTANINVSLPQEQTYATKPVGGVNRQVVNMPMAAYLGASDGELLFRNLCALLKVNVKNEKSTALQVSKIVITSSDSPLSGTGKIDQIANGTTTASAPKIIMNSGQSKSVTLKITTPQTISTNATGYFYVMIPQVTSTSNRFTIEVHGTQNGASVKYVLKQADGMTATKYQISRNQLGAAAFNVTVSMETYKPPFTIDGSGHKVVFAPGNLQYRYLTSDGSNYYSPHWRFAEEQWHHVGWDDYGESGNVSEGDNELIYTRWIDVFSWATSGFSYQPIDMNPGSSGVASLHNTNHDWGVYNAIYNPKTGNTDPANTWRTPTTSEWNYILFSRSGDKYSKANVHGVNGIIIYPDGYINVKCDSRNTFSGSYESVSNSNWNTMETNGCVFLPTTGSRTEVQYFGNGDVYNDAKYWSSNVISILMFIDNDLVITGWPHNYGASVRLVKNVP
ncbi:MAG: hypothetical protein J6S82_02880 [Bacteroidales bacterium]|nr:hypothetical protein [Bacteroidales bacterium]